MKTHLQSSSSLPLNFDYVNTSDLRLEVERPPLRVVSRAKAFYMNETDPDLPLISRQGSTLYPVTENAPLF